MTSPLPIISAASLAQQLHNSAKPPRLFDCRFQLTDSGAGEKAYQEGHLPGAFYAHLDRDLSSPAIAGQTGRHPLPTKAQWQQQLRQWGVSDQEPIIAYDQGNGVFAARFWWLCRWAGLTQVQVLDGGWEHWLQNHPDLVSQEPPEHPTPTQLDASFDDSLWIDADSLTRNDADHTLLDARALNRYSGETEPLDAQAGHIPQAICADFSANLDINGFWLSETALQKRYRSVTDAKALVCYCGSGVSACHTLLALEMAGITGARLYPGSWSEWITQQQRPIETGIPKEPI